MKLTLAFQVYNKEEWIESVMESWLSNLSGRNECEVIVVFDDCKDRSVEILHRYLRDKKQEYMFLFADDRYEIFCNNLALKYASGDYIVFIQDDNWIYDENWDLLLEEVLDRVDNAGAVGLLAGVRLLPDPDRISLQRIEIDRPHKGDYFAAHKLPSYELGVWGVDSVTRPFCISRELLLSCGGLDGAFSPSCGDDLDLGLRLLKQGKTNVYVPFDLLNTVGGRRTFTEKLYAAAYEQAYALNFERHHKYILERHGDNIGLLLPMRQTEAGQLALEEGKNAGQVEVAEGCGDISIGENEGGPSFTIFAMPKSFTDAFATIQENAIGSWMRLKPRPEIILMGDDDGVADFARRHDLKHIPDVEHSEFGTPLVSDLFGKARAAASNQICAYVNADIILVDSFAEALDCVARRFERFLMVGRRWDFDMSGRLNFAAEGWQERLAKRVSAEGTLHAPSGIDYFAFTQGLWPDIPQMTLGRGIWDNWLVREPILKGLPVIDASDFVAIVHQNHGFSHISGGKGSSIFNVELQRNLDLADNDRSLGYTSHATWVLTSSGIALRPVSEFLKGGDLSVALRCIESSYRQATDIVTSQFENLKLHVDPDYMDKLLSVARRESVLGSAKNAARLLLKSLEADDEAAAEELFKEGFGRLSEGDIAGAVTHLEKAAMNCATLPNVHYALAAAYSQAGDIFSAERACRMELSLRPDNRGATELLERINEATKEYRQSLMS